MQVISVLGVVFRAFYEKKGYWEMETFCCTTMLIYNFYIPILPMIGGDLNANVREI